MFEKLKKMLPGIVVGMIAGKVLSNQIMKVPVIGNLYNQIPTV